MKIRGQFLIPVIATLVVVLTVGFVGINWVLKSLVNDQSTRFTSFMASSMETAARTKIDEINNNLNRIGQAALQQVAPFSQLPEVISAYELAHTGNINNENSPQSQQARDQLRALMRPAFAGYQAATGSPHFIIHYHLPNGRSLSRVYQQDFQIRRDGRPLDISDDISGFRATVMQVNRERKPLTGLEIGRGGFDIRGLVPIAAPNGRHLGSVEVQFPLSRLLTVSRTADSQYFGVYMDQKLLSVATRMTDNPKIGNEFVFVTATDTSVTDPLVDLELLRGGLRDTVFAQKDHFYLAAFPLKDFSGAPVGVFVMALEMSEWQKTLTETIAAGDATLAEVRLEIAIFSIVLLALMSLIVFLVTRRVTGPILEAVDITARVAEGDTSQKFQITDTNKEQSSNNEIQRLRVGINRLVDGLREREEVALAIAEGDLTRKVVPLSDQDSLGIALQTMVTQLNEVLSEVQTAAGQIDDGSHQVSDTAQQLSQGATESAASLEEISSSMNEIASQSQQSAANANQASELARGAQSSAQIGSQRMAEMITAMNEINAAGESINKIIKVIDEIAFQTNLLALNAAVEAARAGQHGKGFAVVAEEVRNLAARSAKAARETAELIEGSVEKTANGTQIAEGTAAALEEIVSAVVKVNDLIAEIAAAGSEQAQGISQINTGLGQIDLAVQQSTATAEESAAAAEELSSQSEHLRHMLSRFTLTSDKSGFASPPLKAAAKKKTPQPALSDNSGWSQMEKAGNTPKKPDFSNKSINLDDDEFGKY